jgi:hypothetical protein
MTARVSPALFDPALRRGCASAVKRAVTEAGGVVAAAHHLRISPTATHNYGNADTDDGPTLLQAAALAEAGGIALAEFMAGLAGGRFVAGAEAAAGSLHHGLADLIAECTEVTFRASEALRDGMSAAEERDVLRAIADLEPVLASLKGAVLARWTKPRRG